MQLRSGCRHPQIPIKKMEDMTLRQKCQQLIQTSDLPVERVQKNKKISLHGSVKSSLTCAFVHLKKNQELSWISVDFTVKP